MPSLCRYKKGRQTKQEEIEMKHDRQNINTRYSKIHLARRMKKDLTDLYIEGKVNEYVKMVREYNQLVKQL